MTNKKNIFLIFILCVYLLSCSNGQKENDIDKGKILDLKYQVLSKENLFPNKKTPLYSGCLIIEFPEKTTYLDIAETIRNIGIKEYMVSAKVFNSMTGYLMEIDSIERTYNDYYKSYEGYYDLTTKGLNWQHLFKISDIHFKGEMPLKLDLN